VQSGLQIDLAIVDINMKGLNGIDTIAQLLLISPNTKSIVLSMHEGPEWVSRAIMSGAKGYVSKATSTEGLREAIRMVASGQSYVSPGLCVDLVLYGGQKVVAKRVLTAREREVLQLIGEGAGDKEVALELGISPRTVRFHKDVIKRDFHCRSIADLVKLAISEGLTECRDSNVGQVVNL
jgi:DNA-binding NarL/FixJ family response regulator